MLDLCTMFSRNIEAEGMSEVGAPARANEKTGHTVNFELQINNE